MLNFSSVSSVRNVSILNKILNDPRFLGTDSYVYSSAD